MNKKVWLAFVGIIVFLSVYSPVQAGDQSSLISPDGKWHTVLSELEGVQGIAVVAIDKTHGKCITCDFVAQYGPVNYLQWTPDSRLSFVSAGVLMFYDPAAEQKDQWDAIITNNVSYPTFTSDNKFVMWTDTTNGMIRITKLRDLKSNILQLSSPVDDNKNVLDGTFCVDATMTPGLSVGSFAFVCTNAPLEDIKANVEVDWKIQGRIASWSKDNFSFTDMAGVTFTTCTGKLSEISSENINNAWDMTMSLDKMCGLWGLKPEVNG